MTLSDQPFASLEEAYLLEKDGKPVHLSLELARHDYEAMIEPYIRETLDAVHLALKGAGMTVADIDEILLVGGATRTPLVSERLEQELKQQPRSEVNPDLCVAMGAAIQASMIGGADVSAVLVDITPYTFGTSVLGELNGLPTIHKYAPIIHKNTPIPVTKSEVFFTVADDQDVVDVKIYQGEDPDALNNIQIGEFTVKGLSRQPAGNPIIMKLALDLNGMLNVSAVEKETGLQKSITIDNAFARFDKQEMDQAKARIEALFDAEEMEEAEFVEVDEGAARLKHTLVQARALVEKAERMLDGANPEDREDIVNLIETINDGIAAGALEALKGPMDELSDILFYLES
jgi:molecular chaperone DnaK (HSP70)